MKPIPVNEPLLDGNEKKYLFECIETGWISSEGPFIKQFEAQFAERVGRKYGVAVSNGSVALDAAEAMRRLGKSKIGTRPFFWCMHEQPILRKMGLFEGESYLVAAKIARRGFYVPSGMALQDEQIERVAKTLQEAIA